MSSDRLAVAHVLEQIADFLEFRADNLFRVRAFRNAGKAMMGLSGSVAEALADGSLAKTRGIGPATLGVVRELVEAGRSEYLEQLRREIPAGLLAMLGIPGLGAARIKLIHNRLGIQTVAELETAARDGRLAALPRFGEKTAAKVLKGIAFTRGTQAFRLSHQAAQEAEVLRSAMAQIPGVTRVLTAGEVRRRCELVGELAFVVETELDAEALRGALTDFPGVAEVSSAGTRLSFRSPAGTLASVWSSRPQCLGAALLQATGSASHLVLLEAVAGGRGDVLAGAEAGGPVPDEATAYRALGLAEIPPELREGLDEVDRAVAGRLPDLVELRDLRGFLHCHTSYSDGTLGVEAMASVCRDAGYSYVGITDHSRSAAYAGGMSPEQVQLQWAEIDAVQARQPRIRILKGIESDILVDGALDYDATTLAGFDFVIGSVHSRFSLNEAEMTGRLLRALDNPYLTILGHPTGRLLLSREPYRIDLEQLFGKAAEQGVALEINGDPHRLDLDWRLVRRARELGVVFSIGADAHGVGGLPYLEYATAIARKGGLERRDVLNTSSADEFLTFARARRP